MKAFDLPGTIIFMGTPAEETGGGKWIMAAHGAWKDVDVVLMTHPMPQISTPINTMKAALKFRVKFRGKAAHAAAAPWNGANACDAIVMAYNGLAMLRQHIKKDESIQSVILQAGKAPNIIPDFAEGSFSLRGKNRGAVESLRCRVEPVFESAAKATGCIVEITWSVSHLMALSD
jgi:Xaa-Arg dipeptidase